jgi:hypothetical protein
VVFSITRNKVYHRLNDNFNLFFLKYSSFLVGGNAINIKDNKLCGYSNIDPFKIPKNSEGEQELIE